ncbi:hypothetical protein ACLSZY_10915 [Avibacterium volantium]|uniref:hypothetical protein n=1 Tax=Avibacterium TaxID=292486 RepID=UPI0039FDC91C
MAQQKITLPPRKWYSLEQAAEKLTRESGELVTIDDLLHFAITNRLQICAKFYYIENIGIKIGNHFIELDENNTVKLAGIKGFPPKLESYHSFVRTKIGLHSILGLTIPNEFQFENKQTQKKLKSNLDVLYGFISFYLDSFIIPKDIFLDNFIYVGKNSKLHTPPTKESENIIVLFCNFENKYNQLKLEREELFILNDDIELLKMNLTWLDKSQIVREEIRKLGRPENNSKEIARLIAEETFSKNPKHSKNAIANAIKRYIEKEYPEKQKADIKTYTLWLNEWGIGYKGGDYARDPHKIKIIDPLK